VPPDSETPDSGSHVAGRHQSDPPHSGVSGFGSLTPYPAGTDPPTPAGEIDTRGRRLHPATPFLRAWILVVAAVASVLHSLIDNNRSLAISGVIIAGGLVIGLVLGFASWLFTRYVIDGTELRIDRGIITKESRRIPYERLQSVDIVQPFAARMFGMAELEIEMAGSGDNKTKLAYLPLAQSEQLRHVLLERAHLDAPSRQEPTTAAAAPAPTSTSSTPPHDRTPPVQRAADEVLFRVSPWTLTAAVALSTEFITGAVLLIAALVVALAFQVFVEMTPVIVPIALGVAQVTSKRYINQWGFELAHTSRGLRITRGMLSRTTQTIPLNRIQGIAVAEPLLWRPLRWSRLDVGVAGHAKSGDDHKNADQSTLLPVSDRSTADRIIAEVLPRAELRSLRLHPAPRSARWLRPIGWRFLGTGSTSELVATRSGWLMRRTCLVPHAKVQSVRIRQGPLQRRLGLASVHVDTPPGPVDAVALHRSAAEANAVTRAELAFARQRRKQRGI
jgi:putative membrane protein